EPSFRRGAITVVPLVQLAVDFGELARNVWVELALVRHRIELVELLLGRHRGERPQLTSGIVGAKRDAANKKAKREDDLRGPDAKHPQPTLRCHIPPGARAVRSK